MTVLTSKGRCLCSRFAVVTEAAALAAVDWVGRGDPVGAGFAIREAMAAELRGLPIQGRVVAGRGGVPGSDALSVGSQVGTATGPWFDSEVTEGDWLSYQPGAWDLVVDPLQAPNALARGTEGAAVLLAAGPQGSFPPVPEMYMQKLVVPGQAAAAVDLDAPVEDNVRAVAEALGREVSRVEVVVLDRPRHEDLINRVKAAGARVRLITDGDVSAALAAASRDAGADMYVGTGGSTEGILAAAGLRSLGGEIQARFWPVSRHQVDQVRAAGVNDLEARLTTKEIAGEGVLLVITSVTGCRFLRGISVCSDGVHVESLVLCSRCGSVRKIHTIHRYGASQARVDLGVR